MDAVAVAETFRVCTPNMPMKSVFIAAVFVTCTAFATELLPHMVPLGISRFRHFVVTVVVTACPEGAFKPPLAELYCVAIDVVFTVSELEV
jgi:hypothetical protein